MEMTCQYSMYLTVSVLYLEASTRGLSGNSCAFAYESTYCEQPDPAPPTDTWLILLDQGCLVPESVLRKVGRLTQQSFLPPDIRTTRLQAILAVRTWAVYSFSRRIGYFLLLSGCLTMIPTLVLGGLSVHSLGCAYRPSWASFATEI